MICDTATHWRLAADTDLGDIHAIGDGTHITLSERLEVLAEKFKLFPEGCFVLVDNELIIGYGFSHPWLLRSLPLDTFLGRIPPSPECLFIHDVVVSPHARGHGAASGLIEILVQVAMRRSLPFLALVSVYHTHRLWNRLGFEVVVDAALNENLKSYGDTARYMIRKLV